MQSKLLYIFIILFMFGLECSKELPNDPETIQLYGQSVFLNQKNLNLNSRNIKTVTELSKLKNLRQLNLSKNPISDISVLSSLVHLEEVSLRFTLIDSLQTFKNNKKLIYLDVAKTAVSSIEPLRGNTSIQELDLSFTNVSDLSPLSNNKSLKKLYIMFSRVKRIEMLPDNLELLGIDDSVEPGSIELYRKKIQIVRCIFESCLAKGHTLNQQNFGKMNLIMLLLDSEA